MDTTLTAMPLRRGPYRQERRAHNALARLRRQRNWTASEVARRAGIHTSALYRAEAAPEGRRGGVSAEKWAELARVFGVEPWELYIPDPR